MARTLRGLDLPTTWRLVDRRLDGYAWTGPGRHLRVIESTAVELDGHNWHHVSVSRTDRDPTWAELREVKELFVGPDREAYVVLPPASRYVNLHAHALHLWARCDEADDGAVLPDFTRGGGSI